MSAERTKRDSDRSAEQATDRAKNQFDNSIVEPVRAYGSLTTDYYEELFSAQFDAVRAFAETSLAQSRSWLEVKDSESFRQVVEEQQQAIREMSERLKADADRIRSLSQDYLKETQQLAMESMQLGRKQLEENLQKGQEQREDSLQKGQAEAENMVKQGQGQADKSKKTTST